MTIITSREYSRNPGKYHQRANEGETVLVSSKEGYAELKSVGRTDKRVRDYERSMALLSLSSKVKREHDEGKTLRFETVEELRTHLAAL